MRTMISNPYMTLYLSNRIKIGPEASSSEAQSLMIQLGFLYNTIGAVIKDTCKLLGYKFEHQTLKKAKQSDKSENFNKGHQTNQGQNLQIQQQKDRQTIFSRIQKPNEQSKRIEKKRKRVEQNGKNQGFEMQIEKKSKRREQIQNIEQLDMQIENPWEMKQDEERKGSERIPVFLEQERPASKQKLRQDSKQKLSQKSKSKQRQKRVQKKSGEQHGSEMRPRKVAIKLRQKPIIEIEIDDD